MNIEVANRMIRLRLDLEHERSLREHAEVQIAQLERHLEAAHRRGRDRLDDLTTETIERKRLTGILQGIAVDTERRILATHRQVTTRLREYGVPDEVIAEALGVAVVGLPRV